MTNAISHWTPAQREQLSRDLDEQVKPMLIDPDYETIDALVEIAGIIGDPHAIYSADRKSLFKLVLLAGVIHSLGEE